MLSVGCVSTTDSDGSVTKADGVGLLMVGRNLKCSTTERFSLGFWTGMNFRRNFLLRKEVHQEPLIQTTLIKLLNLNNSTSFIPFQWVGSSLILDTYMVTNTKCWQLLGMLCPWFCGLYLAIPEGIFLLVQCIYPCWMGLISTW